MHEIYIDDRMRLAAPTNRNQQSDWQRWLPGVQVGEVIDTADNPVIFRR